MQKVRLTTSKASLREFTDRALIFMNLTRWSSVFEILKHYEEIQYWFPFINFIGLNDILLKSKDELVIHKLCCTLPELKSVSKRLEKKTRTLSDVQSFFDAMMEH